jgi:uncharacterized membrane protein YjjP (DUF1212 family)
MMQSKNKRPTSYFRLSVAVLLTGLFAGGVIRFEAHVWRESVTTFFLGLLAGYYYTSAWYVSRAGRGRGKVDEG